MKVLLVRPDRGGGAAAHAGLAVDVLDVVADGLDGDPELVGDRLVRLAAHEREQHLELASRQAGRQLARPFRNAVPGRGEDGVDRISVEAPVLRLAPELRLRRLGVEGGPVRARLAHGHVAIGGREDARALVEGRRPRAPVVARAVEALVVRAGQLPDRRQRRRLREGALREVRMEPHALPFPEAEGTRLLPDRVRHAQAADVVGKRGAPHERHGVGPEAHPPGSRLGKLGHAGRVLP